MSHVWARRLTDAEMRGLKEVVDLAPTPVEKLVTAILGVFEIALVEAHGKTYREMEGPIAPWDYAIADDQWKEIGQWLVDASRPQGGIEQANVLLDWMNKGPAAFEGTTQAPTR